MTVVATLKCPWCAEEILAEAKKCKHCGEFLESDRRVEEVQPVWKFAGLLWRCITHDSVKCEPCSLKAKMKYSDAAHGAKKGDLFPDPNRKNYTGSVGSRQQLSRIGKTPNGSLACPNCGGSQFTAKRSNTGKVVGGLIAPKSQVKCVTCGTMFKRG